MNISLGSVATLFFSWWRTEGKTGFLLLPIYWIFFTSSCLAVQVVTKWWVVSAGNKLFVYAISKSNANWVSFRRLLSLILVAQYRTNVLLKVQIKDCPYRTFIGIFVRRKIICNTLPVYTFYWPHVKCLHKYTLLVIAYNMSRFIMMSIRALFILAAGCRLGYDLPIDTHEATTASTLEDDS